MFYVEKPRNKKTKQKPAPNIYNSSKARSDLTLGSAEGYIILTQPVINLYHNITLHNCSELKLDFDGTFAKKNRNPRHVKSLLKHRPVAAVWVWSRDVGK